ncbi:hypothetical protein V8C42DRAFT_338054 [Trichoderma barbatum]
MKRHATVETIICFRCRRQDQLMSTDILNIGLHGFVKIGFNLYYCITCADKTGFNKKTRKEFKDT